MVTSSEALILGSRVLLCAVVVFGLLRAAEAGRKLKFVNLIYRHGDRSPVSTYPKDPHTEKDWPQGFGQLTQVGMRQHYKLGQYLQRRYKDFLNSSYHREEIYVRSTDVDRTLMSALSDLAGLYPPHGHQIFKPDLNWQPIPVHTVPAEDEKLLMYPLKNCPRYEELLNATMNCPQYKAIMRENHDFLKMLSINVGVPFQQVSLLTVWWIYDILYCERAHNFTLPAWVTPDRMEHMRQLKEFALKSDYEMYKWKEKSRLQGGVLLKQILQNITRATCDSNSNPRLKLIMYSAHDTTIAALQMALGVYSLAPTYAACQIFELYQEKDGSFTVEMYYRNESNSEAYLLTLPSCTKSCPLKKFIQITADVIPKNWEKECRVHHSSIQIELILGLAIGSCFLLVILFVCLKLWRRDMDQPLGYQKLTTHNEETEKMLSA
ncbi:prostatic acid phosphatase-like isoform X1 [Carcharodon carcharias]|uniref:prostatic acid phosphatase-like isoform X1 n=2 Tax=Carcharodon carcharias TaxID=13397 RepID=UPI001B7F29A2|nr:prostatic acid phosphatase-like isoform X1 [Carcharodon carcharias]